MLPQRPPGIRGRRIYRAEAVGTSLTGEPKNEIGRPSLSVLGTKSPANLSELSGRNLESLVHPARPTPHRKIGVWNRKTRHGGEGRARGPKI
ncbi:hypothetical protein EVAR_40305_1 [Eumeta japonica]|uniref:Uncharacterized protein n=1 Tax=Eumeta variegata TaxID=151549 RepID=A0A4C1YCV5_EUMVA|nr:hypothetical protein EVAR_40305_1 [Eumeta japonica]